MFQNVSARGFRARARNGAQTIGSLQATEGPNKMLKECQSRPLYDAEYQT